MGIGRWQNEWVYELCESLCFSSDTLFFPTPAFSLLHVFQICMLLFYRCFYSLSP